MSPPRGGGVGLALLRAVAGVARAGLSYPGTTQPTGSRRVRRRGDCSVCGAYAQVQAAKDKAAKIRAGNL